LSFAAILDLDLQPEQTIALRMIMAGSRSTAEIKVKIGEGAGGCRRDCGVGL
jgi:DNA-binding CsgD family transcriptional regulator